MSDEEEGWDEIGSEEGEQQCPCPFCDEVQPSAEDTIKHCCTHHNIDLVTYKHSRGLDFYEWIKLINYIRKEHPKSQYISDVTAPPFPWSDDQFLKPVIPDDPLLQLDMEEDELNTDMGRISITEGDSVEELKERLKETELKLMASENRLKDAYEDMDKMRKAMGDILSEGTDKMADKRPLGLEELEEEDGYFSTYSHFAIHEEMLKDQVRMESYQLFISRNPELFKDKVVLDVGCGTGILSMMAVKSGASHVIAVDQSQIIHKAIEIARENGLLDSITFIRGRVEDVILPVDKVDLIISEWMGYMLLFESMMDTVLYARDKWLRDPRHVYPNNCSICLVAIGDDYEYQSNVAFWDDIGGFKMSCMRREVLKEAKVIVVDEYSQISSSDVIKKFDLSVVKPTELEFESRFGLTMLHTTNCHAIVAYFDIGFEVPTYRVYFSTSPQDTPTHWRQTVFFLNEPLKVRTGDMLKGVFKCLRDSSDHRSIIVHLKMELSSFHKDDNGQVIQPTTIEQSFTIC